MKMKKIFIFFLAIFIFMIFTTSCGNKEPLEVSIAYPKEEVGDSLVSIKTGFTDSLNLGGYVNKKVIVIYYEFTNCSDNAKSFDEMVQHAVYQNGIECNYIAGGKYITNEALRYAELKRAKILPNTSVEIKVMYELYNDISPVEVICSYYKNSIPETTEKNYALG